MSNFPLLLAAVDSEDFAGAWHNPSGSTKQYLVMLGAMAVVAAALLIWAAYFRKRRRHSHHHHHHHHSSTPASGPVPNATESISNQHKRRRRRRREHRPRNPTLAETGGLPPIRLDKPSGPVP